jgi:cysteinyl-tRNA synthetase
MDDDFNTAGAIGVLFELNKYMHTQHINAGDLLRALGQLLGLFGSEFADESVPDEALHMMELRKEAKANRDYGTADVLRDRLLAEFGIVIEDIKDGYRWYIKRNKP